MLLAALFLHVAPAARIGELTMKVHTGSTVAELRTLKAGETAELDLSENQTLSLALETNFAAAPKNSVAVLESGAHAVTSPFNYRSGSLTLAFTPTKLRRLYKHSGMYDLRLMVSDSAMDAPLFWSVAKVNFIANNEVVDNYTDVEWDFQPPKATPKAAVTRIFSALMFVPFLLLIVLLLANGVNCGYFPHNIFYAAMSLAFVAALGGFLAFFVYFWRYIHFEDMLRYMLGAMLILGVLLRFALVGRSKEVQKHVVQTEKPKTE